MIKVVTAHPRITAVAIIGVTTVVSGSIMGISPTDVMTHTGNGLSYAYKYLKAAGIGAAILGVIILLFRFNIIGLKMAPENSAFMVARRGILVRDKQGNVVLHDSGRNRWHVINYRHLVAVHFGDRFVELGTHEFTLDSITWRTSFTLRWRIPKDKKRIERIVTTVSDRNWWDGEFNQLTHAVKEKATGQLGTLLKSTRLDVISQTPEFNQELASSLFGKALDPYGGEYYELLMTPVTRTDAQQRKDGDLAIADAITGASMSKPTGSLFERLLGR